MHFGLAVAAASVAFSPQYAPPAAVFPRFPTNFIAMQEGSGDDNITDAFASAIASSPLLRNYDAYTKLEAWDGGRAPERLKLYPRKLVGWERVRRVVALATAYFELIGEFKKQPVRAFLTREKGANGPLQTLLDARGIATEELPCIAFEKTEGFEELCAILASSADISAYRWVVITSPAAAAFFAEAWALVEARDAIAHKPSIATVGAGSAKVLEEAGLRVDYIPSTANGKALAAELPADSAAGSVLFPSSALAADDIADGLAARGIRTRRINTYTTAPAAWSAVDLARAQTARLVTFGSPSAVRVWTERVGTAATAVCIGETTARAARDCGFATVIAPSRPEGKRATMFEAWAACCAEAVADDRP